MKRYDVVIVGAGMAGLSLAASLVVENRVTMSAIGGEPLKIALVEARSLDGFGSAATGDVHGFDPRVSALTASTLDFLDRCGAWEKIAQNRYAPFRSMFVWDENGTGEIEFNAEEVRAERLGCIVENRLVMQALLDVVKESCDVDLVDDVRVERIEFAANRVEHTGNNVPLNNVYLDNDNVLSCKLLVAADGAHSAVRDMAGIAVRAWDYQQDAIVTTVAVDSEPSHTAWQCFTEWGALAFLPLEIDVSEASNTPQSATGQANKSSQHTTSFYSIVWSVAREHSAELLALSDADFSAELDRRFANKLGTVSEIAKRYSFPLRQQHAIDYVKPGLALIADAAHTVHPLAGQGINLGFADVLALTRAITKARKRGSPIGDLAVLRAYQRERKPDNLAMMGIIEAFKRLYEPLPLPLLFLRNTGMKFCDRSQWIKNQIMKQAMGVRKVAADE